MTGSIDKYAIKGSTKGRWRYRIYAGKTSTGTKEYLTAAGFEMRTEAAEAMRQRIAELQRKGNQLAAPADIPLRSWLVRWINTYAAQTCQPKTLERYRQLTRYVTHGTAEEITIVADTPIASLRHVSLEAALFALLKQKAVRRKHISVRTLRHVAGLLQVALNEAFRLDLVAVNPMLKVKLPSVEQTRARSFTPEQVRALRDICRGDWTFALIELALATGARRGEMLALKWSDVDWAAKSINIAQSLEQTAAGLRLKATKNGKERRCSLPQSAIVALRFQREQQAEHKRLFGEDYKGSDLVFAGPYGDYLKPDLVSQVVIRRMRKSGIKSGSFHSLRHTHASNLLSRGVPLPAVSARLGHADVNITAKVYSHALPDDDRRAADAWESVIYPSSKLCCEPEMS